MVDEANHPHSHDESEQAPPEFAVAWHSRQWVPWVLIALALAALTYGIAFQKCMVYRRPAQAPETATLKSSFSYSGPDFVGQATYHGLERRKDGLLVSTDVMEPVPGGKATPPAKGAAKKACPT